jgi:hypothetical protein
MNWMKKTALALTAALSMSTAIPAVAQVTTSDNTGIPVYDQTPLEGLDMALVCPDGSPTWQSQHAEFLANPDLAGMEFEGKFDFADGSFVALYDLSKVGGATRVDPPYIAFVFDAVGCWGGIVLPMTAEDVKSALGYTEASA